MFLEVRHGTLDPLRARTFNGSQHAIVTEVSADQAPDFARLVIVLNMRRSAQWFLADWATATLALEDRRIAGWSDTVAPLESCLSGGTHTLCVATAL